MVKLDEEALERRHGLNIKKPTGFARSLVTTLIKAHHPFAPLAPFTYLTLLPCIFIHTLARGAEVVAPLEHMLASWIQSRKEKEI